MAGSRIKDVTGSQDYFSPELVLLVDKLATGTGDWLQARKLELSLLGNTYIQGSTNNVNWHDEITSSDIYFNISTDGGVNWLSLDADLLPEGTINKYYTEAKVSANSDVAANIAARHSHSNKSVLDNIINTGDGNNFLSDNGTYKNFEVIAPLIVNGDINATGTVTAGSFVTVTGTSSDFVKGDGSLDSSTYVISSELSNYALLTNLHNAVTVLDSSEIDFTLTGQQITASLVSGSIDESKLNISINTSLGLADSALQSELDPVFTAHTAYNIINGVGFLKNNGTGTWSYDNSTWNYSVQSLLGVTPTWNANSGLNATITLSGNTTITLSNLAAGMTGNLTVTNAATAYTIQFAGYTVKVSPVLGATAGVMTMSGASERDVLSYYYDGNNVYINGTLAYE